MMNELMGKEVSEKILTTAIILMDNKLKELMSLEEYRSFIEEAEKQVLDVAEEEITNALRTELKNIAENNVHDQTGIYRNV